VVGAYLDDIGSNADQGSAYVFARNGASWSQPLKLTASDGGAYDEFGHSVAVSDITIIVGAPGNGGFTTYEGSVYVFMRRSSSWGLTQKLTASDGEANDRFGVSVAVSNDTLVVGASLDDNGFYVDQGSAYIFVRSGAVWGGQVKLTVANIVADSRFGRSVAINGEMVVVGTGADMAVSNSDHGSAYVFVRSGRFWSPQRKLTAIDVVTDGRYGRSVAISGTEIVVGAPHDDIASSAGINSHQGSAYVFPRL
jgi:hypothetical protein